MMHQGNRFGQTSVPRYVGSPSTCALGFVVPCSTTVCVRWMTDGISTSIVYFAYVNL